MRKKSEVLSEIGGLTTSIGEATFRCAALRAQMQQAEAQIQGQLNRLAQLNDEKYIDEAPPSELPIDELKKARKDK